MQKFSEVLLGSSMPAFLWEQINKLIPSRDFKTFLRACVDLCRPSNILFLECIRKVCLVHWTLLPFNTWSRIRMHGVIKKRYLSVGYFLTLCFMQQQKCNTSWIFLALFTGTLTECFLLRENTKEQEWIKREQY